MPGSGVKEGRGGSGVAEEFNVGACVGERMIGKSVAVGGNKVCSGSTVLVTGAPAEQATVIKHRRIPQTNREIKFNVFPGILGFRFID